MPMHEKDAESLSQMITHTADISALLSVLPANPAASSVGRTRKKVRTEEIEQPDLSQYQSGSSSSGNSSPQHDVDVQDSFRVADVDMWEVLEALEIPPPGEHSVVADLEAALHETPRSSPTLSGAVGLAVGGDFIDVAPTGPCAMPPATSFTNVPANVTGTKRPAPNAPLRTVTTPIKVSLKSVPKTAAPPPPPPPVAPPTAAGLPGSAQRDGSDDCEDDGETTTSGDPAEEKRLKRMRRNRESAAMSRNRKKAYIEELESKVASLSSMVQALQNENWALKEENATLRQGGGSHALPIDAADARTVLTAAPSVAAAPSEASHVAAPAVSSSRKFGTAGLALASALTLVTLSISSSESLGSPLTATHAPTSRVLMSLPEELADVPSGSAIASHFRDPASTPLWPALGMAATERQPSASAAMLQLPGSAGETKADHEAQRLRNGLDGVSTNQRVIHLPLNSSWADALRSEAADQTALPNAAIQQPPRDVSEMKLLARHGAWDSSDAEGNHLLVDPQWHSEQQQQEGEHPRLGYADLGDFEASNEAARRFIFCARSYAFDVVRKPETPASGTHRRPEQRAASPSSPSARELSLPAGMPARFRHAAAGPVPQLTDGSNSSGGRADGSLHSPPLPIVSFLLPTAALGGIAESVAHGNAEHLDTGSRPGTDLMQVTCQVLNASSVA